MEYYKMKKLGLFPALVSVLLFFSLSVLTGLTNVGNALDDKASARCAEDADEIEKFYGTYWLDGVKNTCTVIEKDGIVLYSSFMSFSYSNVVWDKVSDSLWTCTAYRKNDSERTSSGKKVILTFKTGSDGTVVLDQYVTAMGGMRKTPLKKGKELHRAGGSVSFDDTDSSAPKFRAPKAR